MDERITVKNKILSKVYSTKSAEEHQSKRLKSSVWSVFHHIFDENDKVIQHHYCCSKCKDVIIVDIAKHGNNPMKRHRCAVEKREPNQPSISSFCNSTNVRSIDKQKLRRSAYNYIVQDVRPISSIEGAGLANLISDFTKFAIRYGQLTAEQVSNFLPSKKSVSIFLYHLKKHKITLILSKIRIFARTLLMKCHLYLFSEILSFEERNKSNKN